MREIQKIRVAMVAAAMGLALSGAVRAEEEQAQAPAQVLILGQDSDRPGFWQQRDGKNYDTVGFEMSLLREAPPFQNFMVRSGKGLRRNAAYAMAYRTWRHVLARHSKKSGAWLGGHLDVAKPLSEYCDAKDSGERTCDPNGVIERDRHEDRDQDETQLIAQLMTDMGEAPVASNYSRAEDFVRSLDDKLRRNDSKELIFAIRSPSGARRRYVFIYKADFTTVDGKTSWYCNFYDPHLAPNSDRAARSNATLRMETNFGGVLSSDSVRIEVNRDWIEATTAGGEAFSTQKRLETEEAENAENAEKAEKAEPAAWYRLEPSQLLIVDSFVDVAFEYGEDYDAKAGANKWSDRINEVGDRASVARKPGAIVHGSFDLDSQAPETPKFLKHRLPAAFFGAFESIKSLLPSSGEESAESD